MELHHRFTVPAPVDVAWEALNDLESVVGCFPGAALSSVEGDEFQGTCKVKLGPISLQYSGSGRFLERDGQQHRAVIDAKGKDRRGNGTAAATITTQLEPEGDDSTAVTVDTDLNVTGRPAQFGRGMMQDVSDRMLAQFSSCLESKLSGSGDGATTGDPESDSGEAASAESGSGPTEAGAVEPPGEDPAGPREAGGSPGKYRAGRSGRYDRSSASDALDLGAAVMPVIARRLGPYLLGGLALLILVALLRRRRSS